MVATFVRTKTWGNHEEGTELDNGGHLHLREHMSTGKLVRQDPFSSVC